MRPAGGAAGARVVVVGAGSAGLTAAWRLSEDPDTEVIVLEAGPNPGANVPEPLRRGVEIPERYCWNYRDADDEVVLPRGKVVGGCSAVDHTGATRSGARTYDDWDLEGWSFADCLPAFRAIETDLDFGDRPDHGAAGPTPVVRRPMDAVDAPLAAAYGALGHVEIPDHNAADTAIGYGPFPASRRGDERASTLLTLLPILSERPNVFVRSRCEVARVRVRDGVATGVVGRDLHTGAVESVDADHVVLAGGTYGTPEILFASGIGPPAALAAAGVRVVAPHDDVGRNLREHPKVLLDVEVAFPVPPANPLLLTMALGGRGRLAHVFPLVGVVPGLSDGVVSFVCAVLSPTSTGRLDLGRGRARVHRRLVDTAADRAQLHDLVDGVGAVLDELARRRLVVVPDDAAWRTRDRRPRTVLGYDHPVGTCRMGPDDGSVCDLRLRVRGVDRLMIADASVMPDIPRSQTNLPAMMIGYRAGEFLDLRS